MEICVSRGEYGGRGERMKVIKVSKCGDGRYYAEYHNPQHLYVNGIGQYGRTPFEAKINLQALLNVIRCKELEINVIIGVAVL